MKKLITAIVLISLLLIVLTIGSCVTQEPTVHTLKYSASEGGRIEGVAEQEVEHEQDGAAVTAVAIEGYEFIKWSDDLTTMTRQDKRVQEDITVTALFKKVEKTSKTSYTITYLVEEGATLVGDAVQTISQGDDGTNIVEVKVRDGYEFLGWSDGRDIIWRSDSYFNIDYYYKEDTTFIAKIRRIDDYKLMDWYTEFGVGVPTITINKDTYNSLSFPIPTREHFTFEGWYLGDTLVADTQGKSYFTKELLEYGERSITAKWTPDQTFTYKILLVYVTRIDANLPSLDQTYKIHVDYTISDLEREFYHWTTIRFKQYLDEMVDGLIDFQVDEYYTTKTVVTKDFIQLDKGSSYLHADQIPEVKDLVKEYDSALSVFSLNDKNYNLHSGGLAGTANPRYGQIYFDTFLSALDVYKFTLEQVTDLLKDCKISDMLVGTFSDISYVTGGYWFYTFAHELAHTIETRINGDNWHSIESELGNKQHMKGYNPLKYYYLQAVLQDDKNVGIPYAFWSGSIMKVRYDRTEGGYIGGEGNYSGDFVGATHRIYDVPYGYDVPTVTAMSYNGYEFVEWSDGVKTATRTDLNATESITVTAIFKPITYQLTVVAGEGGRLTSGEGTWDLQPHKSKNVKAVANEGYKFVGWSDGDIRSDRSFTLNNYELSLFGEDMQYTLTAIFVKIGEQSNYYVLNLIQCENGFYSVKGGLETEKSVLMEKDVDFLQVYAWAEVGYRFVSWSDGNTIQNRTLTINSDLIALSNENNVITIYAIFEKVEE